MMTLYLVVWESININRVLKLCAVFFIYKYIYKALYICYNSYRTMLRSNHVITALGEEAKKKD